MSAYQCPVQTFLRNGGTLADLTSKYAIKVKRHGEFPNVVQLKYDQLASPMGDPIVQECRGLILDENDNWNAVARPFRKFFNLGEGHAAKIDWNTARALEKLDGSLAIVYQYGGTWHMATSGTPDASGPVGSPSEQSYQAKTFRKLFWDTFFDEGYHTDHLEDGYTYMFELMTPENRIVVPHPIAKLTLIGIRHTATGREIDVYNYTTEEQETVARLAHKNFRVVRLFEGLRSAEEVEKSFEKIDGLHQEGYVVVDANFNRIKVKHPNYVLYHQMAGGLTRKKVLDAVRRGESPEIVTYFPTWAAVFNEMTEQFNQLLGKYEVAYDQVKDIPIQKDYAIAVQKLCAQTGLNTGPLFLKRKGDAKPEVVPAGVVLPAGRKVADPPTPQTFQQILADLNINSLADMLGLQQEEENDGSAAE